MNDDRLLPCPSCARHVRAFEHACPFCTAELPAQSAAPPRPRSPAARLSRAALFALGTTAAACGATERAIYGAPAVDDGGRDDGSVPAPIYGAPPVDAAADARVDASPQDAASDANADAADASEGGHAPPYGAPPR